MRIILPFFISLVIIAGCKSKKASKDESTETPKADTTVVTIDPANKESQLMQATKVVMASLANRDYAAFASWFHPDGVRFSPYGHVDTAMDVVMKPTDFTGELAAANQKLINWGEYDGTGDPIKLTLNDYLKNFVYTVDFLKPESFKINTITNPGNAENNISQAYPGSDFTDSHFSGFKKEYDGMDWQSLRLVFRFQNGRYYLVGVIHDQWTI